MTSTSSASLNGSGNRQRPNMACPDPSAHHANKDAKLQNQASSAALYVTNAGKSVPSHKTSFNPLGPDGKLSSAGAAASLKHANPQDLPSYPSHGIDTNSAGNAAALLANPKSFEWWKPEASDNAGKAAMAAKDYKMDKQWEPKLSAGSAKAALLAHKAGPNVNTWHAEASPHGNSAATIAMRNKGLSPVAYKGSPDEEKRKALLAATASVSARSGDRRRSGSTPTSSSPLYPDAQNATRNALNAATISHRASAHTHAQEKEAREQELSRATEKVMESSRITHASTQREMYSSTPPVDVEVEEKKHNEALAGASLSMARKMYDVQQQHINETSQIMGLSGATKAHAGRPASASSEDNLRQQAMQYIHLQDAAHKLAAERLAKTGANDDSKYREYYGYPESPSKKLSTRRGRPRSNSEGDDDPEDEEKSRRIRSQMSLLNKQVASVDAKKRQSDRAALVAAAQKKVHAQMHIMDEKVFNETGKIAPSLLNEWEEKARLRAAADSEARMENHGKVHIGGKSFMTQEDIEAIAAARIQPTLDEVNEKAEQQRARDEEIRLDAEEKKRQSQAEKQRTAELKAEEKKVKDAEKAEKKAKKAEEKRLAKNRKSKDMKDRDTTSAGVLEATGPEGNRDSVSSAAADEAVGSDFATADEAEPGTIKSTEKNRRSVSFKQKEEDEAITSPKSSKRKSFGSLFAKRMSQHKSIDDTTKGKEPPSPSVPRISTNNDADVEDEAGPISEPPKSPNKLKRRSTNSLREKALGQEKEKEKEQPAQDTPVNSPTSPTTDSGKSKRFSSLFSKFGLAKNDAKKSPREPGFIGGSALTNARSHSHSRSGSTTGTGGHAALSSHPPNAENDAPISPLSSSSEASTDDEVENGGGRKEKKTLGPMAILKKGLTGREDKNKTGNAKGESDSSDDEEFEEARDTVDEGLVPPRRFADDGEEARRSGSPNRESWFKEDL